MKNRRMNALKLIALAYLIGSLILSVCVSTGFTDSEIIEHRAPFLVVEVVVGTPTHYRNDGRLAGEDHRGYFIGYAHVDAEIGDKVVTAFIWNPLNNYEDDMIARFDVVI